MRGKVALLVVALATAGAANVGAAAGQPFVAGSYVNQPLAANAPIDPQSPTMVKELDLQVLMGERTGAPPGVSTGAYGVPVYTVPASQKTVQVRIVGTAATDTSLQRQFSAVPIPPDAQPASGSDHELTVYQPSTDRLWEFIGLQNVRGQFSAGDGGEIGPEAPEMLGVAENPGVFLNPPLGFGSRYGATATGIPLLAGLQRISELQAGAINHVVAFGMPAPAPCFRWPAAREDTTLSGLSSVSNEDPLAPPEGAILRLPANLNIDAMHLPPYTTMLAKAVQTYGMVLRDRSGDVSFSAETPQSGDPYGGPTGIFGGYSPSALLEAFPWSRLQVLATPSGKSACTF